MFSVGHGFMAALETRIRAPALLKGGNFDILECAPSNDCPWNAMTYASAAEGGHLGILQWARSHGHPWDITTCHAAALGGRLSCLQWAWSNGCP